MSRKKTSSKPSKRGFVICWDWQQTTPKLDSNTSPTNLMFLLTDLMKAVVCCFPTMNGVPEWLAEWSWRVKRVNSRVLLIVEEKEDSDGKNAWLPGVPPSPEETGD